MQKLQAKVDMQIRQKSSRGIKWTERIRGPFWFSSASCGHFSCFPCLSSANEKDGHENCRLAELKFNINNLQVSMQVGEEKVLKVEKIELFVVICVSKNFFC